MRGKRSFSKEFKRRVVEERAVGQIGPIVQPDVAPVIGGQPISLTELEARTEAGEFTKERFDEIKKIYDELNDRIVKIFRQTREYHKELKELLDRLLKEAVEPLVSEAISGLKSEFKVQGVEEYLREVHDDIINNLDKFDHKNDEQAQSNSAGSLTKGDRFLEYMVNVLIDNSKTKEKPIITEINPNYRNLFGSIEKEAQLSGATHSKGVLIISGYLQGKFAQKRPLSMNAHLCFEQFYGGIDGDSASSTEIYAILSSLAQVPIRQDIAVTGSVNQNGTIQAIGELNEKIE
jgi:predicted ATP-dependent protease